MAENGEKLTAKHLESVQGRQSIPYCVEDGGIRLCSEEESTGTLEVLRARALLLLSVNGENPGFDNIAAEMRNTRLSDNPGKGKKLSVLVFRGKR